MHHGTQKLEQAGLVLALFVAIVLGHSVALSSERVLISAFEDLRESRIGQMFSPQPAVWNRCCIILVSSLLTTLSWWTLRRVEEGMEHSLVAPSSSFSRRLLETAVVIRRPGARYQFGLVLVSLSLVGMGSSVHWVATEIWGWISGHEHIDKVTTSDYWIATSALPVLVGVAFLVRFLDRPELKITCSEPGPYAALILFLSNPLNIPLAESKRKDGSYKWTDFQSDLRVIPLSPYTPTKDICCVFGRNAWLMPVLSIFDQIKKKRLRHVVLIVSREVNGLGTELSSQSGTLPMASTFVDRLKTWIGPEATPEFHIFPPEGADFESPEKLLEVIEGSYQMVYQQSSVNGSVLLDLTGGTKQCSLTAGIASFDPGRVFCYVSTSNYEIRQYDFRPPKEHQHGV